jgi:hypothetical protein
MTLGHLMEGYLDWLEKFMGGDASRGSYKSVHAKIITLCSNTVFLAPPDGIIFNMQTPAGYRSGNE